MNGKALYDKYFGMTEERLKLEKAIKQIFSEIDWLNTNYFGLREVNEHCDNVKSFVFTVPNYIHINSYSQYTDKIHKILFDNGYIESSEIKQITRTINSINTILCENPLFVALELMDDVVINEFNKNGIFFTKFRGNSFVDPYFTIKITKDAMEKL